MPITFDKLKIFMEDHGIKKFDLRKAGFSPNIVDKVLSGPLSKDRRVDTETISRLCEIMHCQPGDIMEYVPDKKVSETEKGGAE